MGSKRHSKKGSQSKHQHRDSVPNHGDQKKKKNNEIDEDILKAIGLEGGRMENGYYTRYVEVPQIEEVVKYVPKKQYVERIREVPVPVDRYNYGDRYRDNHTERMDGYRNGYRSSDKYHDVYANSRNSGYGGPRSDHHGGEHHHSYSQDKYYEDNRRYNIRGFDRDVYRPYYDRHHSRYYDDRDSLAVERHRSEPHDEYVYQDREKETVVSQVIEPKIYKSKSYHQITDMYVLDPVVHPVDVFIPVPVTSEMRHVDTAKPVHRRVDVSDAHYNTLVELYNPSVDHRHKAPLMRTPNGRNGEVPMLPPHSLPVIEPIRSTSDR